MFDWLWTENTAKYTSEFILELPSAVPSPINTSSSDSHICLCRNAVPAPIDWLIVWSTLHHEPFLSFPSFLPSLWCLCSWRCFMTVDFDNDISTSSRVFLACLGCYLGVCTARHETTVLWIVHLLWASRNGSPYIPNSYCSTLVSDPSWKSALSSCLDCFFFVIHCCGAQTETNKTCHCPNTYGPYCIFSKILDLFILWTGIRV